MRNLQFAGGHNVMLGADKNLVLAPINLRLPSGNNAVLGVDKNLVWAASVNTGRNLLLPSGNNAALPSGNNLVLLADTLSTRELLFRQTLRARSGREVYLRQDAHARGRRNAHLQQDAFARGRRDAVLQQDITARAGRASGFAARLRSVAVREQALRQDLHAFARAGYRLFAADLATGQETELGFVPADGPLTLAGVTLADGDYEIRLRSDGSYWRNARHTTAYPVSIEGGEIVTPLPAVTNLRHTRIGDAVLLTWTWHPTASTQAPDDFAIWTAASEPVDTTGDPDQVIPARHPGGYATTIPNATAPLHAAIRARRAGKAGPLTTLAIPAPQTVLASPGNQSARFERE